MFVVTLYSHGISMASNIDHTNNNFGLCPQLGCRKHSSRWGYGGKAPRSWSNGKTVFMNTIM